MESIWGFLNSYHGSMHLSRTSFAIGSVFLGLTVVFVSPPPVLASARTATGHFELYCDGVGLFLGKIDGAPASGKLVLFSRLAFPGGTFDGKYVGQGKWSDVYVFRHGCSRDECESIADGRVWIDSLYTPDKPMSGKYEITLNGKLLKGTFIAKKRGGQTLRRLCM